LSLHRSTLGRCAVQRAACGADAGRPPRVQPCRAIEIDFSDPDTQISLAGMVLGLVAGLGAPFWYINRAEKDEERLEELRALNRRFPRLASTCPRTRFPRSGNQSGPTAASGRTTISWFRPLELRSGHSSAGLLCGLRMTLRTGCSCLVRTLFRCRRPINFRAVATGLSGCADCVAAARGVPAVPYPVWTFCCGLRYAVAERYECNTLRV
nr:anti-phytochrome antibody reactive protein [Chlamydomonas reinhardtii]